MMKTATGDEKKPTEDIEALPPEIRDHYKEVVSYHHRLLERLAQK